MLSKAMAEEKRLHDLKEKMEADKRASIILGIFRNILAVFVIRSAENVHSLGISVIRFRFFPGRLVCLGCCPCQVRKGGKKVDGKRF